jgi:hypothetical protein
MKNNILDLGKNNLINNLAKLLFYILICGLGVYMAFYPTLSSGFALMQDNPGDTRLNNYFLEHSFQLLPIEIT